MATFLVPEVELVELVKKAAILPPIIKNHLTRLITLFLLIIAIFRDFKKFAKFNTIFQNKTIRTLKMFWVRVFFENVFPVFITSSTLHLIHCCLRLLVIQSVYQLVCQRNSNSNAVGSYQWGAWSWSEALRYQVFTCNLALGVFWKRFSGLHYI